MDPTRQTFTLDPKRIREVMTAFRSLARRANKLSIPEIRCFKSQRYRYSRPLVGRFIAIDVIALNPHLILNDWQILGVVEHHPDGNGIAALDSYFCRILQHTETEPSCDHCAFPRTRKRTVIIERDGKTLQVGESCLKDFIGFYEPSKVLRYFHQFVTLFRRLESSGENGFGRGGRLLTATQKATRTGIAA